MSWENRRYIDRAGSAKTRCTTCGSSITKGAPRVVDEDELLRDMAKSRTKRAYHHLACAIDVHRQLAHDALICADTPDELVAAVRAEVARLDAKLADEVRATRVRRVSITPIARQVTPLADPRTEELLVELEAAPQDRGLLTVLGDHLQQRGDERGELIILGLAASTDPDARARQRELTEALSPELGSATWGIGFLSKLSLWITDDPLSRCAATLSHPSCRLLSSLKIKLSQLVDYGSAPTALQLPAGLLPRSLRTLELDGGAAAPSDLSSLRYLEHLQVDSVRGLAHPTLASLQIHTETIEECDPRQLPAVRSLAIHVPHWLRYQEHALVEPFVRAGWIEQLTELALHDVPLDVANVGLLSRALAGRRLARLSIANSGLTKFDRPTLQALCTELVFECNGTTPPSATTLHVEHVNKPEWGRGRILREYDGKVEIAFASGTRTFKADAPYLRRTRD